MNLSQYIITDTTDVPNIVPTIKILDATVAIRGDIMVIGGKEKAGKTSVAAFILAAWIVSEVSMGIKCHNEDNDTAIFVDSEQSRSSTKKLLQTVKKIARVDKVPNYLHAYNLRSLYKPEEKKDALMQLFKDHSNTKLWIIDGIADFVSDPNLSDASNQLIAELMSKAEELNTCIIVFIHENPGQSTKFRGNLGSELQRKCYGAIGIKKDKQRGVHTIESRLLRHSADFEDIHFRYDKEKGHMVRLNESEAEDFKSDASGEKEKRELRHKLAYQCLVGGSERIRYSEFVRRICNHAPLIEGKTISETTAKNRIKDMLGYGIVDKTEGDKYHLLSDPTDSGKEDKSNEE